jgi:hypothetical protein
MSFARSFVAAICAPTVIAAAAPLVGCNGVLAFSDPDAGTKQDGAIASGPIEAGPPSCVDAGCPLATLRCDVISGVCEECLSSGDCALPLAWCDPTAHRCFECATSADCAGDYDVCIIPAHKCAPRCPPDGGPCPPGATCNEALDACVYCHSNDDCMEPQHLVCQPLVGACFECAVDTDCPGGHPFCDPSSFRCVSCLQSSECPPMRPYCEPTHHACVAG